MIGESLFHINTILYVSYISLIFSLLTEIPRLLQIYCNRRYESLKTRQIKKTKIKKAKVVSPNPKAKPRYKKEATTVTIIQNYKFHKLLLKAIHIVCDIIVTAGLFYVIYHCINKCNYGEFRWYFVAITLGCFGLEKISIGHLIAKFADFVYTKIAKEQTNAKKSS